MQTKLNTLESAVLRAICAAHPEDRAVLEEQLRTVTVCGRDNTGAGFYTKLRMDRSRCRPLGGKRMRQGPQASIENLQHGMGFILWLEDGFADTLEGFTYDEATTGIVFGEANFELAKPSGD